MAQKLRTATKPQYLGQMTKRLGGRIGEAMKMKDDRGNLQRVVNDLELAPLLGRDWDMVFNAECTGTTDIVEVMLALRKIIFERGQLFAYSPFMCSEP